MGLRDLAIFQIDSSGKPTIADLANIALGGNAAIGEFKLAQRFLIVLLTTPASIAYQASRGTSFANSLVSQSFLTELDAFGAFAAALQQAKTIVQADEPIGILPANELFADAQVTQITIAPTIVQMSINVISQAGTNAGITIPFIAGSNSPL